MRPPRLTPPVSPRMQIQTHLQLGKLRPRELSTSGGEGPARPTQPPPGAAHPLGPHGTGRAPLGQINWKGPCGYHRAQRLLHLSALGWWLCPPSLLWGPVPGTPCCHSTGAGLGPPAWCDFISKTRTQASRPNKAACTPGGADRALETKADRDAQGLRGWLELHGNTSLPSKIFHALEAEHLPLL